MDFRMQSRETDFRMQSRETDFRMQSRETDFRMQSRETFSDASRETDFQSRGDGFQMQIRKIPQMHFSRCKYDGFSENDDFSDAKIRKTDFPDFKKSEDGFSRCKSEDGFSRCKSGRRIFQMHRKTDFQMQIRKTDFPDANPEDGFFQMKTDFPDANKDGFSRCK
ncbi:hypothetical protein CEXT_463681 [Caerostris extrusa]|uniref:Uncharacterized protein n=1 Tax=Caerostris extrusa TaxID=172846 RepID=A0AAV4P6B7_CAEEX|nr:hypothetical protein CEXT_463681 [Caerostris extrusa]